VGVAALVVSVGIAVYVGVLESAPAVLGIELPLVKSNGPGWVLCFIGYLLTPVTVIAAYGWDAIGQRNALRANRNFVPKPSWTRALLWIAGVSVLVGAWHVLNLSVPLSEVWGPS
jgi:hypothetical protein